MMPRLSGSILTKCTISPVAGVEDKALAVAMAQGAGTVFVVSRWQEHPPIKYLDMRYVKDIEEAWEIAECLMCGFRYELSERIFEQRLIADTDFCGKCFE